MYYIVFCSFCEFCIVFIQIAANCGYSYTQNKLLKCITKKQPEHNDNYSYLANKQEVVQITILCCLFENAVLPNIKLRNQILIYQKDIFLYKIVFTAL